MRSRYGTMLVVTVWLLAAGPASRAWAQDKQFLRPAPSAYAELKRDAGRALDKGEIASALELALRANRRMPDDIETYSLLVRCYLRLGKMEDAEKQAQWMLDLRAEDPLSLLRAADVREAAGEWDGAIMLLNDAYGRVRAPREKADILFQASRIQRKAGRQESAERLAAQARKLVPEDDKE